MNLFLICFRVILHSNSLCPYEENKKRFTRHNSRWKFAEGLEEIEGNPLIGFNSQDKDDVDLTDFPSEMAQEEKVSNYLYAGC